MKRFKFPLAALVLLGLAFFPSSYNLALNGNKSKILVQNLQTSNNAPASIKQIIRLNQKPPPTPSISNTKINDNSAAGTQMYFPFIISPQASYYVSPSGSDFQSGDFQ